MIEKVGLYARVVLTRDVRGDEGVVYLKGSKGVVADLLGPDEVIVEFSDGTVLLPEDRPSNDSMKIGTACVPVDAIERAA